MRAAAVAAALALGTSAVVACSASGGSSVGSSSLLNIMSAEPTSGLDPNTAVTQTSLRVMELMYDTLIDYNAQGDLVPDLATKWTASDGGKSYTFTLRKGPSSVRFRHYGGRREVLA